MADKAAMAATGQKAVGDLAPVKVETAVAVVLEETRSPADQATGEMVETGEMVAIQMDKGLPREAREVRAAAEPTRDLRAMQAFPNSKNLRLGTCCRRRVAANIPDKPN